jgi:methylaspartate mutase epsilon subunit
MQQVARHSILLGGLGGDSHSVGLTILRHALQSQGYEVLYLGTQNTLPEFFENAPYVNLVMVSCMDGHARHYLKDFVELRNQFHTQSQVWYLGGNPQVEQLVGGERVFMEMGFRRAFLQFVEIEFVLGCVAQDLADTQAQPVPRELLAIRDSNRNLIDRSVEGGKLEPADFERARKDVLQHWPTGRGASVLRDSAEFLLRQPQWMRAHEHAEQADELPLLQPRSGVAGAEQQLRLFRAFNASGVKVLSYQVDSLTRNNNYSGAEEMLRESRKSGVSLLNGFPVVNHGVQPLRQIISRLKIPLQVRHSTRDPRLLAEISYAGGVTAFEGGAICYNVPYYKSYPLADSIRSWRYVDRLTGLLHEEYGIVLDREYFGTLTATLIPPCVAIATGILESLLALEQGVKCVSIGYAEQGNRTQDIAAIRSIVPLASEVFREIGHKGAIVSSVFYQFMAAFPLLRDKAQDLIVASAATARLAGASRMLTKTPVEAFKIPSLADNLEGISLAQQGVRGAALGASCDESAVAEEMRWIRKEVWQILESVIAAGRGDVSRGIVDAFDRGLLDIPFAPSIYNRGEAMTGRDLDSAVRFIHTGRYAFDREVTQFHRERISARCRVQNVKESHAYQLVEQDVLQVLRGQYEQWPLKN